MVLFNQLISAWVWWPDPFLLSFPPCFSASIRFNSIQLFACPAFVGHLLLAKLLAIVRHLCMHWHEIFGPRWVKVYQSRHRDRERDRGGNPRSAMGKWGGFLRKSKRNRCRIVGYTTPAVLLWSLITSTDWFVSMNRVMSLEDK